MQSCVHWKPPVHRLRRVELFALGEAFEGPLMSVPVNGVKCVLIPIVFGFQVFYLLFFMGMFVYLRTQMVDVYHSF